ncbi:MAG: peptidoglycan-binding protein [Maritimibacter sp.]
MKLALKKTLALGAVVFLPHLAVASDVALIVAESDYARLPDVYGADRAATLAQVLEANGFQVTTSFDQSADTVWQVVDEFRDQADISDRVLVILSGHMVSTERESWLLTHRAERPNDLSVGSTGLPLGPIMDIAAAHQGQAVVMLAPSDDGIAGPGLAPGIAIEAPQGVTLISGPIDGLMRVTNEVLLAPGTPPASALARPPRGVSVQGFLSDATPFLPAEAASVAVEDSAPQFPTAEEIEADLGLDRDARRQVQRNLALLGNDPHGIDGIFGPATRRALADWQSAEGYAPTGYLTEDGLEALAAKAAVRAEQLAAEAEARRAEEERKDTAYWKETGRGSDEAGLRAYLERYPDGLYAEIADQRLSEIEADKRAEAAAEERSYWDQVRAEDQAESYRTYLERYPQGAFAEEAQARLAELTATDDQAEAATAAKAEETHVAGNIVTRLLAENQLAGAGYNPGRIDGQFDETTRRAIRRFQQAQGLEVTGYVTQATMVRLLVAH